MARQDKEDKPVRGFKGSGERQSGDKRTFQDTRMAGTDNIGKGYEKVVEAMVTDPDKDKK